MTLLTTLLVLVALIGVALYLSMGRKGRPHVGIVPTPADERPWRDPYADEIADKIGRRG
jgi:hypothetical protein